MRTTQREVEAFEERLEVLEEEKNTIKSMISTYADHVSNVLDVEHKMYVLDLRMQAVELGVQGLDTRFQVMEKDVSEIKSDIKLILAHLNIKPLNHEPAPEPATVTPTLVVEQPTSTTLPRTISEPNLPPPRISPVVQQSERQNLFSRSLPSLPEPARELEEEMTNLTKGMLKLRGNFSLVSGAFITRLSSIITWFLWQFLRKSMANLRQ